MPGIIPKVDSVTFSFPDEVVLALAEDLDVTPSNDWAVVEHGSTAGTARPDVTAVYWIGTVTPTNMTTADIYNGPTP